MAEIEEYQLKSDKEINSSANIKQLLEKCTYGPYQRRVYICVFITQILSVVLGMNLTFITSNVPFLCYPPNYNISAIPANFTENEYLQMFHPEDDHCSVYNNTFTEIYYKVSSNNLSKVQCSYGRKFLTEKFSSIISEFDLVCEKKWLRSTLQSVYFVGYLFGSIVFGVISDRFGRKRSFFLANLFLVVCGLGKIFVPSLTILMILLCFQGYGYIGQLISIYTLSLELATSGVRTPFNFCFMCTYSFGAMLVPGLAYAITDWHYLDLTSGLLSIFVFFFWTSIPESPRWLIGRKRFAEAQAQLLEIMKTNKIQNQEVFNIFTNDKNSSSLINVQEEGKSDKRVPPTKKNYSFIDLFKTFQVATITINICCSWCVISMLYYGVTLNSVDMAGNRYVNFVLMMVVEIPSYFLSHCLFTRFDHRKPIVFFMIFSGLNCIVSNFATEGSFWFPLILVVLGKLGISAAYGSIYLLSAEIFPTVVRVNGIGIASVSSRIGGIAAPFILQLSSYVKWLPLSIYGVLSVAAGLLLLLLPETKDRDLPQTFEDLKNWKTQKCINKKPSNDGKKLEELSF
ncbi:organic cation transporter protein-like [Octopus sinensis]|uniref:Organic cation transporter protein-like n=1 Tax=Octopus sinensis TaxID=2607531 RepID=A0A6P7T0P3_9MOLL|nr:organic cation transporter protein-like [Octopus sinensis]